MDLQNIILKMNLKKFNVIFICLLLLICSCNNRKKMIIDSCFDTTGWHRINIPCDSIASGNTKDYFIYWNDGKMDSMFAYIIGVSGTGGKDSLTIEPLKNKLKNE